MTDNACSPRLLAVNPNIVSLQAEEDLYGDLSGLKQDTQAANTATAARVDSLAPPTAPKDVAKQPDESAAQNSDLQALDLGIAPGGERTATPEAGAPEEGLPEDLSVEDAFSRIAVAVSKKSESPRDVVLAVSALASQADAYKRRTTEQHQQHIAQQIQVHHSPLTEHMYVCRTCRRWCKACVQIVTEGCCCECADSRLDGYSSEGKKGGSRGQGRLAS